MHNRNKSHRLLTAITVLVLVLTMLASGVSVLAFAPAGEGDEKLPAATETNTGGDTGNNDTAANGQDNSTTGGTGGSAANSGAEQTDAAGKDGTGTEEQQQGGQPGTAKTDPDQKDRDAAAGKGGNGTTLRTKASSSVSTWEELAAAVADPDIPVITVTQDFRRDPADSIVVSRTVTIQGQGSGTAILQSGASGTYEPMFVVKSGGSLTLGDNLTLHGQKDAQGTTLTVSNTGFSGTKGNEKAFFVQIEKGGTFVMDGNNAWIRGLITDKEVMYAAPVVSHGGTVLIKNGTMHHNSVGYSAVNSRSGEKSFTIGKESAKGDFEEEEGTLLKAWKNTETAGAMILSEGSKCILSGGSIEMNRGDTGAIVVQGKHDDKASTPVAGAEDMSYLVINGGKLYQNAGVHHAGAIYVFNGAHAQMDGGTLEGNFSWMKGGAVWVSEEAYASQTVKNTEPAPGEKRSKKVGEAAFTMNGGQIKNNMTVKRGGAINVQSNHVALLGGTISGNVSRELGGGVYLEGDPGRVFQMYVPKGVIYKNRATVVGNQRGDRIQRIFSGQGTKDDRTYLNNITDPDNRARAKQNTTGNNMFTGFHGEFGVGGGLWLCTFGGEASFDMGHDQSEVIISDNIVTGTSENIFKEQYGGKDVFARNSGSEIGNGIAVRYLGVHNEFVNEKNNEPLNEPLDGKPYHISGPLTIRNEYIYKEVDYKQGIKITDNVASCGGGIAANGTVVFGHSTAEDIYHAGASIRIAKKWADSIPAADRKPVTLRLNIEVDSKRIVPVDNYDINGYEVKLNGIADRYVNEETTGEDEYTEDTPAYEIAPWVAQGALPLTVLDPAGDGGKIPLFVFEVNGTKLDPSKTEDLETLYKGIEGGTITTANAKPTGWKMVIEEVTSAGAVKTRIIEASDPVLSEFKIEEVAGDKEQDGRVTYKELIVDEYGNITTQEIEKVGTYTTGINFDTSVTNDLTPAAEKYVDKQKHTSMGADEVLTYDVLAYVPLDAEEFTLTDELSAPLQFCDSRGDQTSKPSETIQSIAYRQTNDHMENGSVAARPDGTVSLNDVSANISGQKLTVHLDKGKTLNTLRGKWVQLTFTANIKPEYRNSSEVLNNGITNQAVYNVSYGSSHKSEDSVKTDVVSSEVKGSDKKASGKKAADTGDHTDAGLWLALMAASAGGIMVLTLRRRRRV